jgi:hypothetical protein
MVEEGEVTAEGMVEGMVEVVEVVEVELLLAESLLQEVEWCTVVQVEDFEFRLSDGSGNFDGPSW